MWDRSAVGVTAASWTSTSKDPLVDESRECFSSGVDDAVDAGSGDFLARLPACAPLPVAWGSGEAPPYPPYPGIWGIGGIGGMGVDRPKPGKAVDAVVGVVLFWEGEGKAVFAMVEGVVALLVGGVREPSAGVTGLLAVLATVLASSILCLLKSVLIGMGGTLEKVAAEETPSTGVLAALVLGVRYPVTPVLLFLSTDALREREV